MNHNRVLGTGILKNKEATHASGTMRYDLKARGTKIFVVPTGDINSSLVLHLGREVRVFNTSLRPNVYPWRY